MSGRARSSFSRRAIHSTPRAPLALAAACGLAACGLVIAVLVIVILKLLNKQIIVK